MQRVTFTAELPAPASVGLTCLVEGKAAEELVPAYKSLTYLRPNVGTPAEAAMAGWLVDAANEIGADPAVIDILMAASNDNLCVSIEDAPNAALKLTVINRREDEPQLTCTGREADTILAKLGLPLADYGSIDNVDLLRVSKAVDDLSLTEILNSIAFYAQGAGGRNARVCWTRAA